MDIGVIARRYAKALLKYAIEEHAEDLVYKEVLHFIDSYENCKQVADLLGNPIAETAKKERVLCAAASDNVSPVFRNFVRLVLQNHRETYVLFICHSYVTLYRELKRICIGRLTTAVPVSTEVSERLEKWMEEKSAPYTDVIMESHTDPNLLGGFIFEIDDRRIDASIASQFEKIKKQFIEKNKRIV